MESPNQTTNNTMKIKAQIAKLEKQLTLAYLIQNKGVKISEQQRPKIQKLIRKLNLCITKMGGK